MGKAGENPFTETPLSGSTTSPSGDVLTLPPNFFSASVASGTAYRVQCSVTTSNAASTGLAAAAASVQVTVETNEVPLVAVGTVDGAAKYGTKSKARLNSSSPSPALTPALPLTLTLTATLTLTRSASTAQ